MPLGVRDTVTVEPVELDGAVAVRRGVPADHQHAVVGRHAVGDVAVRAAPRCRRSGRRRRRDALPAPGRSQAGRWAPSRGAPPPGACRAPRACTRRPRAGVVDALVGLRVSGPTRPEAGHRRGDRRRAGPAVDAVADDIALGVRRPRRSTTVPLPLRPPANPLGFSGSMRLSARSCERRARATLCRTRRPGPLGAVVVVGLGGGVVKSQSKNRSSDHPWPYPRPAAHRPGHLGGGCGRLALKRRCSRSPRSEAGRASGSRELMTSRNRRARGRRPG